MASARPTTPENLDCEELTRNLDALCKESRRLEEALSAQQLPHRQYQSKIQNIAEDLTTRLSEMSDQIPKCQEKCATLESTFLRATDEIARLHNIASPPSPFKALNARFRGADYWKWIVCNILFAALPIGIKLLALYLSNSPISLLQLFGSGDLYIISLGMLAPAFTYNLTTYRPKDSSTRVAVAFIIVALLGAAYEHCVTASSKRDNCNPNDVTYNSSAGRESCEVVDEELFNTAVASIFGFIFSFATCTLFLVPTSAESHSNMSSARHREGDA